MPKTIVFCADGTWNGLPPSMENAQLHSAVASDSTSELGEGIAGCSNVYKLFDALGGFEKATSSRKEREKVLGDPNDPVQIAKYIHGVGDSSDVIQKFAEGAFGIGVLARIARGYTYLSRNYQDGDQIFIVGFSRGAYTARALAGMIAVMGLLQPALAADTNTDRFDNAFEAWNMYRQKRHHGLVQDVADFFERMFEKRIMARNVKLTDGSFVGAGTIEIQAVGVWDTVGAMGMPFFDWHIPGTTVDVFRFTDTELSSQVLNGIHAMSIDEKRPPFTPTFWDDRRNVIQRLFAGAHSDVGGGYTRHGLSDCALLWMIQQLERCSRKNLPIQFDQAVVAHIQPNPLDLAHTPWDKLLYQVMNPQPRRYPQNHQLDLDPCVVERMKADSVPVEDEAEPQPYRPTNIGGIGDGP